MSGTNNPTIKYLDENLEKILAELLVDYAHNEDRDELADHLTTIINSMDDASAIPDDIDAYVDSFLEDHFSFIADQAPMLTDLARQEAAEYVEEFFNPDHSPSLTRAAIEAAVYAYMSARTNENLQDLAIEDVQLAMKTSYGHAKHFVLKYWDNITDIAESSMKSTKELLDQHYPIPENRKK